MPDPTAPEIHLVTDRRRLCPAASHPADAFPALERQVADAVRCGVSVVQLRERDLDVRALVDLATRLQRLVAGSTTTLVVNERADVAILAAAGGVHLPCNSAAVSRVRGLLPQPSRIGRSAHSLDDVLAGQDADYLIFGTMFSSRSKPGQQPQGEHALREASAASRVPVMAIGGITPERAVNCARVGAAGIAAIGLFLPADTEPEAMGVAAGVRAIREAFDRGRTGHVQ